MSYIKVSGGIFMDMTIHDFDMVRYLAGSEVTEVTAYGAVLSGAGYEEYGDVENAMISSAAGVEVAKPTWFFLERYNNAFIAEAKAFTDAVLNDTDTPVTGFDGLQPVKIAMTANLSMKKGRPVKLSEIDV